MKIILIVIGLTHLAFSVPHEIYKRQVHLQPQLMQIEENRTLCVGPYVEPGECKDIRECQSLLMELRRLPDNEAFIQYLRNLNQLCESVDYHVCCEVEKIKTPARLHFPKRTREPPKRLLDPSEGCGYTNPILYKTISGNVDRVGDWPWMALIGYDDGLSSSPFRCDGVVISARHVITAAQCVHNKLTFVRMGEHDLGQEDESDYMDIKVIKTETHPHYNPQSGYADIAILYLERNIDFSENISPICLPHTDADLLKSYVNSNPFVTGWEKTRTGEKALQVLQLHQITIFNNKHCRDIYSQRNNSLTANQFENATVCAGFTSSNRDGCHGDAGSPLMMPELFDGKYHFYLIGISAFSVKCVKPEFLVSYTNTRYFIDWIKERVADTDTGR